MRDIREEILVRLTVLLAGVVGGPDRVHRDMADFLEVEKPCAIVLSGIERIRTDIMRGNFVQMPPAVFRMLPQIFVILHGRDTTTNLTLDGVAAPIAPELSRYRSAVVAAITGDETLAALCTDNGQIEYNGMDTDMQTGSTIGALGATIQFHFAFSYPLDPGELA